MALTDGPDKPMRKLKRPRMTRIVLEGLMKLVDDYRTLDLLASKAKKEDKQQVSRAMEWVTKCYLFAPDPEPKRKGDIPGQMTFTNDGGTDGGTGQSDEASTGCTPEVAADRGEAEQGASRGVDEESNVVFE